MELEKIVEQHEDKLKQHDKELARLNDMSVVMQNSINEGLARVDESNKFLREQNREQLKQNNEIFQAVMGINESKENKEYEAKMMTRKNIWRAIFAIGGFVGGFILAYFKIQF
ncbi:hypothetical protein [Lactococcus sp. NH2-7C]|jgi:hypothetical protein|uniref:hypothetical protein n=1 Tax=Lactococcus TaxID=1357 RepID=UPI001CDD574C|nr:hypothetical protein [Lactococcus sp. NH2-7C]MCA2388866.1 hypothetical protein [Lactococcus sp. NH2-7C]MCI2190123.1 hypothetical protein [Lactococcus lactis]WGV30424.1 hypothetical protein QJV49_00110 [Lactococcus sp. NH2-7C]